MEETTQISYHKKHWVPCLLRETAVITIWFLPGLGPNLPEQGWVDDHMKGKVSYILYFW